MHTDSHMSSGEGATEAKLAKHGIRRVPFGYVQRSPERKRTTDEDANVVVTLFNGMAEAPHL